MSRTVKTANRAVRADIWMALVDKRAARRPPTSAPTSSGAAFVFCAELINQNTIQGRLSSKAFPYPVAKYRQACRNR